MAVAIRADQNDPPVVMPIKQSETLELSVVMPCLNEAETLETCIRKAQRALRAWERALEPPPEPRRDWLR